MIDPGLKEKIVLITGANHGIGACTASLFAKMGAKVFITYLRMKPEEYGFNSNEFRNARTTGETFYRYMQTLSADRIVTEINNKGGLVESLEMDLNEVDSISGLFDSVESVFGPVDILINNAAYCKPDTFIPTRQLAMAEESVAGSSMKTIDAISHDKHFFINCRAPALLMAEYAKRYIQRNSKWGRIVNVSTDGASCFPTEISYGASKHALESYSRSMAVEMGPYGVTCNVVSLGPVQTGWITPENEIKWGKDIPMRRIGKPEDVANAIVFLASNQAQWITGQLLYIGGGHVMHL